MKSFVILRVLCGTWFLCQRRLMLFLPRQACGILVSPLAESSAHAGRQFDAGFAKLVAQAVGGGHRVFPALLAVAFEQVDLIGL